MPCSLVSLTVKSLSGNLLLDLWLLRDFADVGLFVMNIVAFIFASKLLEGLSCGFWDAHGGEDTQEHEKGKDLENVGQPMFTSVESR
jgi:hypothetical protein